MEARRMLAIAVDAAGWTKITPSADTRTVYVSNSTGSDSNDGLSEASPVKSLAKGTSLLRNGSPDWLVLKRGDVFSDTFPDWVKSGKNAQEPMVIGTYGDEAADRPLLKTGASRGWFSNKALHDVAMIGIDFSAHTRDPKTADYAGPAGGYGFQIVGPASNILVEDCSFDQYVYNVSIQGFTGYAKNITFRRDQFTDAWEVNDKCVGFYASQTDGLLIEDSLFDHNGWIEGMGDVNGYPSHDVYLWATTKNSVIRNNIIADSGHYGLQARGGGIVEGNLFLRNPIGLTFGNGSTVAVGGVTGKVISNVFIDSHDINGEARGWAMDIGNIKAGEGALVADNIIANDTELKFPAIKLGSASTATNPTEGAGLNDLTIERNIIYNWYQGLTVGLSYVLGGTGYNGLNNLIVRDNDFQATSSQKIIHHAQAYNGSAEHWSNNRYSNKSSTSGWFYLNGATTSLAMWQSKVEPTAQNQQMDYPDPGRTAATYNATLGGTGTLEGFLNDAAEHDKRNWSNAYTAAAAISYIRAGFTGATPSEKPGDGSTGGSAGGSNNGNPGNPPVETSVPSAVLVSAPDITAETTSPQLVKVTYTDTDGIQANSFGVGDLKITGPDGFTAAGTFVGADKSGNGTPRTATYAIAAPGGSWDSTDDGTYSIQLNANGVRDVTGEYAAKQLLGSFDVDIDAAAAPAPTNPFPADGAPVVLWSNFDPVTRTATVRFSADVSKSLNLSDLRMKNVKTSELIPYSQMKLDYDKSTNTATWTFTQPIAAADYKIIVSTAGVFDSAGVHLDGNSDGVEGDDHFIYVKAAELAATEVLASLSA